jgi:hypothetical protein
MSECEPEICTDRSRGHHDILHRIVNGCVTGSTPHDARIAALEKERDAAVADSNEMFALLEEAQEYAEKAGTYLGHSTQWHEALQRIEARRLRDSLKSESAPSNAKAGTGNPGTPSERSGDRRLPLGEERTADVGPAAKPEGAD